MNIHKLRHWKHADAGWFRDLDNICFPADTSFTNNESYHWWVLENDDGDMLAYAGLMLDSKGVAHFTRCGVIPRWRGMGLQKRLIKARLLWAKRRGVRVVRTYTVSEHHPDAPGGNPCSDRNLIAAGFKGRLSSDRKYIRYRKVL